jgi:hypothetical protein
LRLAAIAYLGHMWELYAFWALVPALLSHAIGDNEGSSRALCAFSVIAVGSIGCIFGGYLSARVGSQGVACLSMTISAAMCLAFPLVTNAAVLLVLLHVWGFFVIADSPQLSTLASEAASSDRIGSTLALLNGVGFLLTAISIHLVMALWSTVGVLTTWVLFPGPCAGALVLLAAQCRFFALARDGTTKRGST